MLAVAGAPAAPEKSILVYGDSLSAAYGIRADRGWVALLERRLAEKRIDYTVANASISGETTAGGLARIDKVLERHRPTVLVLQLGGNDGLRGLPVAEMEKNLAQIIERSQKAGARVLLVGMRMPPNYGPDYTRSFEQAFGDLAKRHRTAFLPFLLEGIAERNELFLPDRLHLTEAAQPLLLERVWKSLRPLLK